ncbi:MAG: low molecular weight phosphotyrosine protein phosphatase [Clostridia bacterium]|nr:low molecular weight phosphotyrosine protein phosphatase [Clostridia bacterium]
MIHILFICRGNICRSPMAEFLMRDMIRRHGLEGQIRVASAATSREELGHGVYPPVGRLLSEKGISCEGKTAVQVRPADYEAFDYIVCMDRYNLDSIARIIPKDPAKKICLLTSFTGSGTDVEDPWYTDDFVSTYNQIKEGCAAMLLEVRRRHGL